MEYCIEDGRSLSRVCVYVRARSCHSRPSAAFVAARGPRLAHRGYAPCMEGTYTIDACIIREVCRDARVVVTNKSSRPNCSQVQTPPSIRKARHVIRQGRRKTAIIPTKMFADAAPGADARVANPVYRHCEVGQRAGGDARTLQVFPFRTLMRSRAGLFFVQACV